MPRTGRTRPGFDRVRGARLAVVLSAALALATPGGAASPRDPERGAAPPERCLECHEAMRVLSHPVGVIPPARGRDLPLAADGTITCGTCHAEGFHSGTVPLGGRGEPGALCGHCHTPGGHPSEPGLVHLVAPPGAGRPGVKPITATCLGCHDGSLAPSAHVGRSATRRSGSVGAGPAVGESHPVGIRYADVVASRPRGYRAPADVPGQILLEEGLVGCLSCHDPYAPNHGRLVASGGDRVLCLGCHAKGPLPPGLEPDPRYVRLHAVARGDG